MKAIAMIYNIIIKFMSSTFSYSREEIIRKNTQMQLEIDRYDLTKT